MNELRMYVEHLFEGKVLTAENIELKEEIYGNLVARYEDYLSEGMTAEEALAQTKASITSVDDVVDGAVEDAGASRTADEALESAGGAGADGTLHETAGSETASESNAAASRDNNAEKTVQAAAPKEDAAATSAQAAETAEMPRPAGTPVPPQGVDGAGDAADTISDSPAAQDETTEASSKKRRKKWPVVVGIVAVVLVLCVGLGIAWNVAVDPSDYTEDVIETQAEQQAQQDSDSGTGDATSTGSSNASGSDTSANNASNSSTSQDTEPTFSDYDDQLEYETTKALLDEIDENSVTVLQTYAGDAVTNACDLAPELPLGSYCREAGVDGTAGSTVAIDYTEVPDAIDGDAIEYALAYNATALFSAYPDVTTVRITLQEQDDSSWDADTYTFERTTVEQVLASLSNNAITQLTSSLIEHDDDWDQVKAYLSQHDAAEHLVDRAEHEGEHSSS